MSAGETSRQLEVVHDIRFIGYLSEIGKGAIGPDSVIPPTEQPRVLHAAAEARRPVTNPRVAFCGDGRRFLRLGNITDPETLRSISAHQLFGGTYLAATKAAVAAQTSIAKGASSFTEVFNRVATVLGEKYEDSSHAHCGAEGVAPDTVSNPLSAAAVGRSLKVLGALGTGDEVRLQAFEANKRAMSGDFFKGFSAEWRQSYVKRTFPDNYGEFEGEHEEGGLLALNSEQGDLGFAKNQFVDETGKQLFAVTTDFAGKLANDLGGSPEERSMLRLAMLDDAINVADCLIAPVSENYPGLAVFAAV